MILPKERDQRLITIRRGGTLSDDDHRLLALWAAACAGHVLEYFEQAQPNDHRPHHALAQLQAWVRGELSMSEARAAGGHANAAARGLSGAARFAGFAAAQAALVAHVAAHNLGAAAYAIKAVCAAATKGTEDEAGRQECAWQHAQLPATLRAFVLDDQRARNPICWGVFAVND
ncbi:putative immunity protein [Herpetosiphon giganteus]|uniref:putative immunity protein n=1 Tax=Herpetosiphon giganteus TaxID=2029754 RepID=UPI003B832F12